MAEQSSVLDVQSVADILAGAINPDYARKLISDIRLAGYPGLAIRPLKKLDRPERIELRETIRYLYERGIIIVSKLYSDRPVIGARLTPRTLRYLL